MHSALKQTTFQSPAPPVMGAAGIAGLSDEDEHLTRAIAASMASDPPPRGGEGALPRSAAMWADDDDDEAAALAQVAAYEAASAAAIDMDDDGDDDVTFAAPAAVPAAALSPEALQAEASARLPPEPGAGEPACRVAIRLPSNARAVRAFRPQDRVQALYDFAVTQLAAGEAAQAFVLGDPSPGGVALRDRAATLADVNAAGGMFLVKWM